MLTHFHSCHRSQQRFKINWDCSSSTYVRIFALIINHNRCLRLTVIVILLLTHFHSYYTSQQRCEVNYDRSALAEWKFLGGSPTYVHISESGSTQQRTKCIEEGSKG